jgi:hypothetical protein
MKRLEKSSGKAQQGQSQEIRPLFLGLNLSQDKFACGSMVLCFVFLGRRAIRGLNKTSK